MALVNDNIELESFLITKHSWKGKYKRILSIGSSRLSTYSPDKYELTNSWAYSDIIAVAPSKISNIPLEFLVTIKKDKKVETLKFSSEFRAEILSSIHKYHRELADASKNMLKFQAYKYHWSGITLPTVLVVSPFSLDQLDPTTNVILSSYLYKDIEGLVGISDYEGGIVLASGGFSRLHLFKATNHHEIIQSMVQKAQQYLAINLKILNSQITIEQFEKQRFGKYCNDIDQMSNSEFVVQKVSNRHPEPVQRLLCLTGTTILERDPQTYNICTLRPLKNIFALVRDQENIQKILIEYKVGIVREYITNDRDSLLATVLDAVRSSGNGDVHVRMRHMPRKNRVVPLNHTVDEETEANLIRSIINNFHNQSKRFETLDRFNSNISHTGLNYSVTQDGIFAENKEKLILAALQALAQRETDNPSSQLSFVELEAFFHALNRLLITDVGYASFTQLPGFRETIGIKINASLTLNDIAVTYAAIEMMNSLIRSKNSNQNLKQEQLNKLSILSSETFLKTLLDMWTNYVDLGNGALVLSAMLDFLVFTLCMPYSETTDSKQFDLLLKMVAERGKYLYKLFQHSSLAIVKGAGLVLRAIIEEGDLEVVKHMQELALDEAALCKHLLISLFTPSNEPVCLGHRQLSRSLVSLWITDSEEAMDLCKRIFPAGILMFLRSSDAVPDGCDIDEMPIRDNLKMVIKDSKQKFKHFEAVSNSLKHWRLNLLQNSDNTKQDILKNKPVILRNRRKNKKESENLNFPYFFYNFYKDHNLPNLIWNHKTREELKSCLTNELRQFLVDRDLMADKKVAWNYQEFEVKYQCLADEIKIGDYYIRLIIEQDNWPENLINDPLELFNALYRRIVCQSHLNDDQVTLLTLKALAKVYQKYHSAIGKFNDMPHVIQILEESISPSLRDTIILLMKCLVLEKGNCLQIVDSMQNLVDLMTLVHLMKGFTNHSRNTNIIEANTTKTISEEKFWYCTIEKEGNKQERLGPLTLTDLKTYWKNRSISPKTKCWATGMDSWQSLELIPQLKWSLMAKGLSIYNGTELAEIILDIFIKCSRFFPNRTQRDSVILIPAPKISRKLSDNGLLTHIAQVCLTYDPSLVERVATLLYQILEDNAEMPKVYLTGIFYFLLMYTGSNVLPIARFLKMSHMKQCFRKEKNYSCISQQSILVNLLPEAMICFLEKYPAEKFSEIFLGEFDTPEVIWNSEMRRLLIQKISAHISDFSPKLKIFTKTRYSYLAIPAIIYPQLENELFCDVFYLRNLCDQQKYHNWPISEPVNVMRNTLDLWTKEMEKKPSEMTIQQAYDVLGISIKNNKIPDEAFVRKSYYKLAQTYHPDKNPEGREAFQKANQAYEFLCSNSSRCELGPNLSNITLILQTQIILFQRFSEVLQPYKYAGYPLLMKTIKIEAEDPELFSKKNPFLVEASKLCYHTLSCSVQNMEELLRGEGVNALLQAFNRCVSKLNFQSTSEDFYYKVIFYITKCFEIASRFQKFTEDIVSSSLVVDICRVVYLKHSVCINLASNLAINNHDVQCELVKRGFLWSLLLLFFNYDYTLDDQSAGDNNNQKIANSVAEMSVLSCILLCGYNKEIEKSEVNETVHLLKKQQFVINPKPTNLLIKKILDKLLTNYLSDKIASEPESEVLKTFSTNTRNPYIIWNNSMRVQLKDFLEGLRSRYSKQCCEELDFVWNDVKYFKYELLEMELKIGGIFVNVYNDMPTFRLNDPDSCMKALLEFLKQAFSLLKITKGGLLAKNSNEPENMTNKLLKNPEQIEIMEYMRKCVDNSKNNKSIEQYMVDVLQASIAVIKSYNNVEIQLIGYFHLFFEFLSHNFVNENITIKTFALDIIAIAVRNKECINEIATHQLLGRFLGSLKDSDLKDSKIKVLETLMSLLTIPETVKEAHTRGATIYLLDIFCNSNNIDARELSAKILSKMFSDRLTGPKIRITANKFLPAFFLDSMIESPKTSIQLFESAHEHPELIWNEDSRKRISTLIDNICESFYSSQKVQSDILWKDPEVKNNTTSNEIEIAGVYLRLFVENPSWTLHKPKLFLSSLLDCFIELISRSFSDENRLELLHSSLIALLRAQPKLADGIPILGHIPKLFKYLDAYPIFILPVVLQLSIFKTCVSSFSQTQCILPLKRCMTAHNHSVGKVCEIFNNIFVYQENTLINQALEVDLIQFLLKLLETTLDFVPKPSTTKAYIVATLKYMTQSPKYGERVSEILLKSSVWSEYKDQKHDLFIFESSRQGYLTGANLENLYLPANPSQSFKGIEPPPE